MSKRTTGIVRGRPRRCHSRAMRQVSRRGIRTEKRPTEPRDAKDALREREERFRVLADTTPVATIVYQGEKQVYVNDATTALLGYSEKECLEMKFWEWIHDDFKEQVRSYGLARQRGEQAPPHYEFKCFTKSGEEKWVFVSAGQIEYHGAPAGIASIVDITDRKRMEEELRHAQSELEKRVEERTTELRAVKEEWERTFASVPDMIAIIDNDYQVQRVNQAMADRLGLAPEKCIGARCYELVHGLSEPPPFCPHLQTLADRREHRAEMHEDRLGGDFLVGTIPLDNEKGEMTGSVHMAYDITDRKRADEALRESESCVRRKLESILDPEGDTGELELSDILDAPEIQALMDDLYRITGLKMSIIDVKGKVLVDVGWQDICSRYHRINPETCKRCQESDTELTVGIPQGEFRTYRCKNNMWHIATPVVIGGRHLGNLFMGQFFFDDEEIDYDLFRAQARDYGFPEEEYIAALEAVPRHSRELVDVGRAFFVRLTDIYSKLSYGNIKLAQSVAERDRLTAILREANMVVENSPVVVFRCRAVPGWPVELVSRNVVQLGYAPEDFISGNLTYSSIVYPDDLQRVMAETEELTSADERQFVQEYRVVTGKGDVRWVLDETTIERNENGEITHYGGVIIDVTERKRAEEALRESEELFRVTIENMLDPVFITDNEGRFTFICGNTMFTLGYTVPEIKAMGNISTLFGKELYSPEELETRKEILNIECVIANKDGTPHHFLLTVRQVSIKDGTILYVCHDITERKQTLEKLRESEERLRLTLEATEIGTFEWDIKRDMFIASPTYYAMLGYEPKIGYGDRSERSECFAYHPEDKDNVHDKLAQVLTGSLDEYAYEARMLHADGSYRWNFVKGISIERDEEGKVARMLGIRMDITERKQAGEALQRERDLLQTVMDGAKNSHLVYLDRHFNFVQVNETYALTCGYQPEQMVGKNHFDLYPDPETEAIFTRVRDTGEPYEVRDRPFKFPDQPERGVTYWDWTLLPVKDGNGGVVGLVFSLFETTDRKRAEDAIRESRAKYQAIVDSFDGLIYICSQDHRIEFMNRKLIERTGRDATGELCYKVLHDRDSACPWCVNERIFAGETIHWETLSPKDNRWYHVINVPIVHADGSMSKHSMIIDITDRKVFEQELQRQKALLQELNINLGKKVAEEVRKNREKDVMLIQQNRQAALGEMLDHIAHQWKQPLNSLAVIIQDMADISSEGELTDEQVQETVAKTMSLLEHMAQTIDVFRGFYRLDKTKKVFNIKESVDQAIAFIGPAFRFNSVAVELDVDSGLTAFGYSKEFAQVLLNILGNARDIFRSRAILKPRLVVRAFAEGAKVVVTIADNAGGIPEAILGNIFDFYFTTNESGEGTGIGLYMSKNIIESMGGKLSAENTDTGALFRIELSPTSTNSSSREGQKT